VPSLFDRLASPEDSSDSDSSGVTPLEIAGLPADQRRIMLWMLRDRTASAGGISASAVQGTMRDAPADCANILAELARGGWLLSSGDPPDQLYRVNLRRKRGNTGFNLLSVVLDDPPTQ
jgi:hypothetical protein